ncbi:MAG: hypothetical protein GY796_23965 [Chloroflexi bacterium]|nr:hypothetical protein [Chloroflexota bacterium]
MNQIIELYGVPILSADPIDWLKITDDQQCPFIENKCTKVRKSSPHITIGSCAVSYGRDHKSIIICPNRLLKKRQIFLDCIHLLTLHEPGNQLHVIPEISIPGGSVDYVLLSTKNEKVRDFVGIELQTLDTTGTTWPARQKFLTDIGVNVDIQDVDFNKSFGMNWKMTAKTILIQLNHKIKTFENLNKHLVLVLQDHLLEYMQREFQFSHLNGGLIGDSMQFHVYSLEQVPNADYRLNLDARFSTNTEGVATSLGLQADPNLTLEHIVALLESKLSSQTLLTI